MSVRDRLAGGPRRIETWAANQARAYREDTAEARPIGGYLAALGVYSAAVAGLTGLARKTGRRGPSSVTPWDVVLIGVATHKLSRTVAKDAVTSPARAPFVHFERAAGEGEVVEDARYHGGPKHAAAELLTCPFCLAQWVATGFVAGWVFIPRFARLAALTMAGVAVSDYLQLGYAALQKAAE